MGQVSRSTNKSLPQYALGRAGGRGMPPDRPRGLGGWGGSAGARLEFRVCLEGQGT